MLTDRYDRALILAAAHHRKAATEPRGSGCVASGLLGGLEGS
jgi:hypothetical protein